MFSIRLTGTYAELRLRRGQDRQAPRELFVGVREALELPGVQQPGAFLPHRACKARVHVLRRVNRNITIAARTSVL